jgi:hypothetical protein
MSVFDWHDHEPGNDAMPWMHRLKEINPAFKATLFAIPGLADDEFWDSHPDWIELAVHGHLHPNPYECVEWSYERMEQAILSKPSRFIEGWCSPGWQSSDEVFEALEDHGWWIACQHLEDARRPPGLRTYYYEDGGDRWHGHTHNVCGNGIEETWGELSARVAAATDFRFASEALS